MSFAGRLYRNELGYDFVGRGKRWYAISAVVLVICLASILIRGFNFGIEFEGGNSFQVAGTAQQLDQAEAAAMSAGAEVVSAQVVGQNEILIKTGSMSNDVANDVSTAVAGAVGADPSAVSNSSVSPRWGGDITNKAVQALIVFLIAVSIFIAIRFQPKMAIAAMIALLNDLLLSAGVYSLIGFEVTPSTVIGLLTILGFSLYDTVVVFDKVDENTRGILGGTRQTYSEAANLAVNQTLMRSINTSLIALLPVAALLFVGAGLLGAGTLKDLALVLFVGLATGAYSSIFLATPIVCDLKEREPRYAALRRRVQAKRSATTKRSASAADTAPAAERSGATSLSKAALSKTAMSKGATSKTSLSKAARSKTGATIAEPAVEPGTAEPLIDQPELAAEEDSDELVTAASGAPRPGAKPAGGGGGKATPARAKSGRPAGKPQARRSGGRPSGKRKR